MPAGIWRFIAILLIIGILIHRRVAKGGGGGGGEEDSPPARLEQVQLTLNRKRAFFDAMS